MARTVRLDAKKLLSDAPSDKLFWSHDGQVFKNLKELERGLANMSDETFRYHVSEQKNDFGNWVRDVIGDQTLARALVKARTRLRATKVVANRVAYLQRRL